MSPNASAASAEVPILLEHIQVVGTVVRSFGGHQTPQMGRGGENRVLLGELTIGIRI